MLELSFQGEAKDDLQNRGANPARAPRGWPKRSPGLNTDLLGNFSHYALITILQSAPGAEIFCHCWTRDVCIGMFPNCTCAGIPHLYVWWWSSPPCLCMVSSGMHCSENHPVWSLLAHNQVLLTMSSQMVSVGISSEGPPLAKTGGRCSLSVLEPPLAPY